MSTPFENLSAKALQTAYERSYAKRSSLGSEMIAAGRGYEKPSETLTKTDELALRVNAEGERFDRIRFEMDYRRRWHGSLKPIKGATS